jgi:alkylation response protein AidB-like acyl-CoA dehydrogenase
MDFDFSPDQYALRDAARDFFAGECPPEHVRAMWSSETGRSRRLWRQMAETGFVGLTVPEEHGGLGLNEVDLVLLLEEAGYAALPEPLLETTAIGVPLLLEAGTEAQRKEWLPRIAAGDAVVTVQVGGAPFASDAHLADLLLLERGGELYAVPRERVHATFQPSQDGARRLFSVRADLAEDTRMAGGAAEATRAFHRGAAGTAALLNGIAQRLLDMAVGYAQQRQQFGRPVGSFQAVKHKLAETLLVVETSKAAAWYAAYAIARDLPDRSQAAAIAKSYASDAEEKANRESLQVHGGIGFTWEHDLHLWLKRGKALEQAYGSATAHRAHLAAALLG